ncbi:ICOS ligand [Rhynchocyon petersi]
MERGDFSLHLQNITPQDEQTFHCLVLRKSLGFHKVLHVEVTLHVAANYSMPVVSTPTDPSQDEEVTFTCKSTNGYPKPNVYWINRTDNSLLDEALQNSTVSVNEHGLYDVVSVLSVRWAPDLDVQCCIENVLLHQNLTVGSQIGAQGDPPELKLTATSFPVPHQPLFPGLPSRPILKMPGSSLGSLEASCPTGTRSQAEIQAHIKP